MRLVLTLGGVETVITERRNGSAAYPWLLGTGPLALAATAGHLEGIGIGESANVAVRLNNDGGQASRLIGYAPRAPAVLYDDSDEPFITGLVQQISYGNPLVITIEAGGGTLLDSEPLPLRTTRALGDYAEDVVLPWIFGDLTAAPFPLIRLSELRYFVADHVAEVTKVFVDRQPVLGWAAALETDDAGRTWTVVVFTTPVPQDADVSACARGLLDAVTGELIENPADMIAAVKAIAGQDEDYSELRAECSALGLRAATRISTRSTNKVAADTIAQDVGAISWHGGARLYPAAVAAPIIDLDARQATNLQVTAAATDTADVLRVGYDRSDASGRDLHYIELTASPQRFGGLAKEVSYPCLRTPANAEVIGRPVLQRLNGERYAVSFETAQQIFPGTWVRLLDHPQWTINDDDPVVMVLSALIDEDNGSRSVVGETIVGESEVTVTAYSIALPDATAPSVDVSVRDGVATFTFTDADGRPIPGAYIALDGGQPKTTDAQGKVRFPVNVTAGAPINHELAFQKDGFVPFTVIVPL